MKDTIFGKDIDVVESGESRVEYHDAARGNGNECTQKEAIVKCHLSSDDPPGTIIWMRQDAGGNWLFDHKESPPISSAEIYSDWRPLHTSPAVGALYLDFTGLLTIFTIAIILYGAWWMWNVFAPALGM